MKAESECLPPLCKLQPDTITGDIVFILEQREHPKFKRKSDDLFVEHTLSLTEALCGFQFPLTHLDRRQLLIKTNPGEVIRPGQLYIFLLNTEIIYHSWSLFSFFNGSAWRFSYSLFHGKRLIMVTWEILVLSKWKWVRSRRSWEAEASKFSLKLHDHLKVCNIQMLNLWNPRIRWFLQFVG